ncbi:hypothetical protein D3C71_1797480 [compost metagenome]
MPLLREQVVERVTRLVVRTDQRALPDAPARQAQAQVVFVVLVAHQCLVKAANALEQAA